MLSEGILRIAVTVGMGSVPSTSQNYVRDALVWSRKCEIASPCYFRTHHALESECSDMPRRVLADIQQESCSSKARLPYEAMLVLVARVSSEFDASSDALRTVRTVKRRHAGSRGSQCSPKRVRKQPPGVDTDCRRVRRSGSLAQSRYIPPWKSWPLPQIRARRRVPLVRCMQLKFFRRQKVGKHEYRRR